MWTIYKYECHVIRPNKCTQTFYWTFLSVGHNVISLSTKRKTYDSILEMTWKITSMCKTPTVKPILAYVALAACVTFSLMTQQSVLSVPLCAKKYIIVILFSMVGECMCWKRLQYGNDSVAKLIFLCRRQNYISPLLTSLHWLPIKARIDFKQLVVCHTFSLRLSHIYLNYLLLINKPKRNWRTSYGKRILCIFELRASFISFCCPTVWKSLLMNSDELILSGKLSQC